MATIEKTATYEPPGRPGSPVELKERYDNFIGGAWVPPTTGEYRDEPDARRPASRSARSPRSTPADIELALDAAHAAKDAWAATSAAERAAVLNAIADAMEANLEMLAVAESWENGKPVRETLAADIPLADRPLPLLRRRRSAREEGRISEIDEQTVRLPLPRAARRRRPDHPVQLPAADGGVEDRPGAGRPATARSSSPPARRRGRSSSSAEVIGDIVPPGVLNIVNGPGAEIGKALASNKRIAKVAFTGETVTGRLIMSYAAQNLIPSTTELGGKSPNIFFEDVMAADDAFLDKAIEGLVLYAFNKGEVCTCPSRALIQESIYDEFMARCLERIARDHARATRSTRRR